TLNPCFVTASVILSGRIAAPPPVTPPPERKVPPSITACSCPTEVGARKQRTPLARGSGGIDDCAMGRGIRPCPGAPCSQGPERAPRATSTRLVGCHSFQRGRGRTDRR